MIEGVGEWSKEGIEGMKEDIFSVCTCECTLEGYECKNIGDN